MEQQHLDITGEQTFRTDYFCRIEALFSTLKGRSIFLSPANFRHAMKWYEATIPLSCVLRGMRAAFMLKKVGDIHSLNYCNFAVLQEWDNYKSAERQEPKPAKTEPSDDEVRAILESLIFDLKKAAVRFRKEGIESVAIMLEPIMGAIESITQNQTNREMIEWTLSKNEETLKDLLQKTLPAEIREKYQQAVLKKLNKYKSKMPADEFLKTKESAVINAIRTNYAIPRLTLYGI